MITSGLNNHVKHQRQCQQYVQGLTDLPPGTSRDSSSQFSRTAFFNQGYVYHLCYMRRLMVRKLIAVGNTLWHWEAGRAIISLEPHKAGIALQELKADKMAMPRKMRPKALLVEAMWSMGQH